MHLTFLFKWYFGETYRFSLLVISLTPSSQSLAFTLSLPPPSAGTPSGALNGSPLKDRCWAPILACRGGGLGGEEMAERMNPALCLILQVQK